ncbi:unnamed protein product [Musa acuminata subsp. malaccensis]|uniref:(wild Malaysian banana) hypothetical protein n=1 Tax=Musa acuminata subsp. malaccensis TaxID=214687 RepID=A0A8D7ATL7_MUSAM|nr:unnamed protein product [Musa acuminata subsp. malaccensis]
MNQRITLFQVHEVISLLNQRGAGGRRRIKQRRHQVLSPADAVRVVAGPGGDVHEQVAGVARVGSLPVHPRARRRRLQWRLPRPLKESVAERVGDGAGHQGRQVDHHAVDSDVAVGRHQRRRLWPVHGLVEGPRAPARALLRRVAHPDVGGPGVPVGTVQAAVAHAEALDRHVLGGEHERDSTLLRTGPGGQLRDLGRLEGLPEGALLVRDLFGQHNVGRLRLLSGFGQVNFVDGLPPLWDGRSQWLRSSLGARCEGEEEVGHDGLLGWGECPVPHDGDGDVALEHCTIVVREEFRWLFNQARQYSRAHVDLCQAHQNQ